MKLIHLPNQSVHVILKIDGHKESHFLNLSDIMYCKAESGYTRLVLEKGGYILVTESLSKLHRSIKKYGFFDCHRSYMVNLAHVQKCIHTDECGLMMKNNEYIPPSRRKRLEMNKIISFC